jgi:hypothetical protein
MLYAFYGDQRLMNSSWPMFRGNAGHTGRAIQRAISRPTVLPDATFAMNLTVETGRTYQVDISTNLRDWAALTNFVSSTFSNLFVDVTASNSAARYYRLSTQMP